MRIVVGGVEVVVQPGYAWVENGRVTEAQIPSLREALSQAQEALWSQT
jgi:hypothetical protein